MPSPISRQGLDFCLTGYGRSHCAALIGTPTRVYASVLLPIMAAAGPHIDGYIRLLADPRNYELVPPDTANIWTSEDSPKRQDLVHGCQVQQRRLTDEASAKGYVLFERARKATADDPKARGHVAVARIPLQLAMFRLLSGDDPRLKAEAIEFLRVAKEVGLDRIERKPISEYRDRLSKKLGVNLSK